MNPNTHDPHPISAWHNANLGVLHYLGNLEQTVETQGHALAQARSDIDSIQQRNAYLEQTVNWLQRARVNLWGALREAWRDLEDRNRLRRQIGTNTDNLQDHNRIRRQMGTNTDSNVIDASTQTDPEAPPLPLAVAVMYCGQDASTGTELQTQNMGTNTSNAKDLWACLAGRALYNIKTANRSAVHQKVATHRKNADRWARVVGSAILQSVQVKRNAVAANARYTRKLWRQLVLHAIFANQQMVQLLWAKMAILAFRTAEFTQEMTEDERRGTIQWDALPAEKKTDTARARMRICTRSWLFMQESNLQDVENPTFKRESLAMQKFPAKIKNFFLELFDIIHQTTQQRKIALSHVSETVYAAVVRDVVELKLGGLATVNDTWTALIFYIPGYDKDKVQIGFKMATITMLVNIYEETSDKVVTLYEQYFPESMNTARKEHIQKSQEKRTQSLTLLKDQLKLAFGRRFHIGGFEESEKGLPLIVIETRMVFPDGREIFTKKWRTVCTVYEALEKLYSQVFYHMFHGQVLEAEAKLGVQYNLTGIFLDAGGDA